MGPSSDEYAGRSPEGTRAGLGAARRPARKHRPLGRRVRRPVPRGDAGRLGSGPAPGPRTWAPRPTSTPAGPPRGRGPAWERPGARPANIGPSSDEYVGRSPEGTRAGLGAARRP